MIDLITYFINSKIGIIIISTSASAVTALKLSKANIKKYTEHNTLNEVIEAVKIATIVTIVVLFVVMIILGLINFIFNIGWISTPEFLKFAEVG